MQAQGEDRRMARRPLWTYWGASSTSSYALGTHLYVRIMGLVYVAAFASLAVQMPGLVGPDGILPTERMIESARGHGLSAWWSRPTHAWLSASSTSLVVGCLVGAAAGLALALGRWPRLMALLAWLLHLSLVVAGRDFLYYQWDNLLCEAGLLLVFLVPSGARLPLQSPRGGHNLARWLSLWLLVRVVFASGVAKLVSGDPAWANCTALSVHYQTQPLPGPLSYYAHQLPDLMQRLSCVAMFLIQILGPLLLLAPRRLRHVGAMAIIGLMLAIALTGNYGYFNLLTAALALLALDDDLLRRWRPVPPSLPAQPASRHARVLAVLVLALTGSMFVEQKVGRVAAFAPMHTLGNWLSPLRSFNRYGLFAVMTMERPELVIEGSMDGRNWKPYELPYKPGDLRRCPSFVAPHMPRLDWQLWFAALNPKPTRRHSAWLTGLLRGLLTGREPVVGLFAQVPFEEPPKQIRIRRYLYRFAGWNEDAWWRRDQPTLYLRPVTLRSENEIIFAQPVDGVGPNP